MPSSSSPTTRIAPNARANASSNKAGLSQTHPRKIDVPGDAQQRDPRPAGPADAFHPVFPTRPRQNFRDLAARPGGQPVVHQQRDRSDHARHHELVLPPVRRQEIVGQPVVERAPERVGVVPVRAAGNLREAQHAPQMFGAGPQPPARKAAGPRGPPTRRPARPRPRGSPRAGAGPEGCNEATRRCLIV